MPRPPAADVVELESNDLLPWEAGDRQINRFEAGQSLGGVVATPWTATADRDVFTVSLQAGQVLEVRVAEVDPLLALDVQVFSIVLQFDTPLDGPPPWQTMGGDGVLQLYAPRTTDYVVVVKSAADPRAGGRYRLETRLVEPSPRPLRLGARNTVEFGTDDVEVFTVGSAPTDTSLLADGECAGIAIEPVVVRTEGPVAFAWLRGAAAPSRCAEALEGSAPTLCGSVCRWNAVTGERTVGPWSVVVQGDGARRDGRHSLLVDHADVRPLAPGERLEDVLSWADGALFGGDLFSMESPRSEVIRIEVTTPGLLLHPVLEPWQPSTAQGGSFFHSAGWAVGEHGHAAMEFERTPGDWVLRVDDARNWPLVRGATPARVGGPGYSYSIEARTVTWTPRDVALPLDERVEVPPGSLAWYRATQPGGTALAITAWIADGTNPAGSGAVVSRRDLRYWVHAPPDPGAEASFVTVRTEETPTVQEFGVRDVWFRGRSVEVTARLFELDAPRVTVHEQEPNQTRAQAQRLVSGQLVRGTSEGTSDTDLYAVDLPAGGMLMAWRPPNTSSYQLRVLDASGAVLVPAWRGTLVQSPAVFYRSRTDARVFVEVTSDCETCVDRSYELALEVR